MGCYQSNPLGIDPFNLVDCVSPMGLGHATAVNLHHFKLLQYVGVGGSATVRAARKISGHDAQMIYAIKSLTKASLLQKSKGPTSAIMELRILAILDSPFICNIYYAFQDDSFVYFVLDLAVGGDMKYNMLRAPGGHFDEATSLFYIIQLLLALDHCHKKSILHRDIKPENILLETSGYVKLTDFGVSKILPDIENCRSTSGTHGYMAPEIYKAPHQHGTASEWFSVGVTLHEFLTGCRPFPVSKFQMSCAAGKTITSINFSILKQSDRVSADAKDFIEQLLDISPISRLGSKNGLEDFKSHNWLIDYDWTSVSKGKSKAPIIPNTNGLIIDIDDLGTQREIRDRSKVVSISDDDHKKFALFRLRDTQPHFSIFICGMTENKSTLSLEEFSKFIGSPTGLQPLKVPDESHDIGYDYSSSHNRDREV